MKKFSETIALLLLSVTIAFAQPQQRFERIHAAKVAYITDRLHFTADQSQHFWPVYNQYEQEAVRMRRSFFQKYKGTDPQEASDAAARQYIDDNLEYQEAMIELKRKYKDQFAKIISPQQLAELFKAEREFKQLLIQQLKERRGGGRNNR